MSSDITNALNSATKNIRLLNLKKNELTSCVNNMQTTVVSLQNDIYNLQTTINNLKATVNKLQTTVNNLEICKLNKTGDSMSGNLDMKNSNITNVSLINNFDMTTLDNNLTMLRIDVDNKVDKP